MALYQGVTGKISTKASAGGTEEYLAHMTSWNVDMSMAIDEQAFFGGSKAEEGFTEKTPGVKSWTASGDGAADFATTSGQNTLLQAYLDQEPLIFTFYLDENTGLQGEGYIESLSISHSADGKAEMSISVSGNKTPVLISA